MNASVVPSGEKRGWWSWLGAERQLPRRGRAVGRDEPQRVTVAVEAGRDGLERDDGVAPVRRQARLGRDAQAVQVVGAGRSGHVDPPTIGTPRV